MIELAMMVPLLMLFMFIMVEGWGLYHVSQQLSGLSREVANVAYRDCTLLSSAETDACLSNLVNTLAQQGNNVMPNFDSNGTVIASVYESDPDNAPAGGPAPVVLASLKTAGGGGASSNYDNSYFNTAMIERQEVIAVAEVFYNYQPLTPLVSFFNNIFPDFQIPTQIYEITIF